ncbi:hypothetical protein HDU98_005498, partial [Podochytrium sp. JEL0797]
MQQLTTLSTPLLNTFPFGGTLTPSISNPLLNPAFFLPPSFNVAPPASNPQQQPLSQQQSAMTMQQSLDSVLAHMETQSQQLVQQIAQQRQQQQNGVGTVGVGSLSVTGGGGMHSLELSILEHE